MGQTCGHHCNNQRLAGCRSQGAATPKLPSAPFRSQQDGRGAQDEEPLLPFHSAAFQVTVACTEGIGEDAAADAAAEGGPSPAGSSRRPRASRAGWRSSYALGPILGDGISAKVYEAEALTPGLDAAVALPAFVASNTFWHSCGASAVPQCLRERGRRVAIKRFHRVGSRTFQKELTALRRVGVFPHVLRLLESYEGFDGEDVLVLEYCDGSTMYDLYAKEHPNGGLPERLIARLIRQLLLALEHLSAAGVEHQDVKPENMMLHDVSVAACTGELKLGDFGWAAVAPPPGAGGPASARVKPPATGAGSLWYAPPELNPPVKTAPIDAELPVDSQGNPILGRSDMWSVGVVLYLLLVGHNPFNLALKQSTPDAVDSEVLRLAALGQFNKRTERWAQLHMDARDLISVLLRVKPSMRPGATEALHHPFITRRTTRCQESTLFFQGPVAAWADREASWRRLDGFQRLAWLAVARAVAEPELDRSVVSSAMDGMQSDEARQGTREAQYLWQLARELATTPVFQWLQDRGAWPEVLRLAFAYLDIDEDGLLSASDLSVHVARSPEDDVCSECTVSTTSGGAWSLACRWAGRWQDPESSAPRVTARGHLALPPESFREALLSSRGIDDVIVGVIELPASGRLSAQAVTGSCGRAARTGRADGAPVWPARAVGHDEEEICWTDMVPNGSGV